MRTLALLTLLALAGMLVFSRLAFSADALAEPQLSADQAAAQAAAADASAALARAAEVKAPAETARLYAEADAYAADAAATVQERLTWLALDAGLRRRMNDLRVFGMGFLLGTLAVGLPTLAATGLLRLLLGGEWRRRLFGSGVARPQPFALPPPATRGGNGDGRATPAGEARHRRPEAQA
jgi:hypothetical protein